MKKNQINWNHAAGTISEAFGLNDEQREDVQNRVIDVSKREETVSKAASELIELYEEDPAKQAYSLLILEQVENKNAMEELSSMMHED